MGMVLFTPGPENTSLGEDISGSSFIKSLWILEHREKEVLITHVMLFIKSL